MPAPDSGDDIVDAVLALAHQMRQTVNERLLAHAGLTLPRMKVLHLVATAGPLRPRDVADRVMVAPRTVTETVDGLEADGLVTRMVHPTDRRAVLLVVTELGRTRLAEAHRCRSEVVRGFTKPLGDLDRAHLLCLLRTVLDAARPVEIRHDPCHQHRST